jgi:hypothetical protein
MGLQHCLYWLHLEPTLTLLNREQKHRNKPWSTQAAHIARVKAGLLITGAVDVRILRLR